MTPGPLVSIVIPCYNAAPFLGAALRSCLNQTYQPIEIVVVDDGSTDASGSIARGFAPRVKVVRSENQGQNAARNLGYALSTGEFVQFFDADDVLLPDKIAASMRAFEEEPALDVVFTSLFAPSDYTFDERIELPDPPIPSHLGRLAQPYHDRRIEVPHLNTSQPLYRRRALERHGLWDENLKVFDDLELNFRMFVSGAKYRALEQVGVIYRFHPSPTRVSWREHPVHPDAVPAIAKLVDLAIRTGWRRRDELRRYLRDVCWYAARDSLCTFRLAQARTYLDLARRVDPAGAPGMMRRLAAVAGPLTALTLAAIPRFLAVSSRRAHRRIARMLPIASPARTVR